jgi:hypothetical protein
MPEERETKLAALRATLEAGKKSGVAKGYSLERVLRRIDETD